MKGGHKVECSLCGAGQPELLYRNCRNRRLGLAGRFDLVRCQKCGVAFLVPPPSSTILSALYTNGYHSHTTAGASRGKLFKAAKELCLLPYHLRFGREEGTFPLFGEGRLLDVGCGTGDYLLAMASLGWRCFGCDVSETALGIARKQLPQAQLARAGIESLALRPGSFEAVTLWHTLEHLENPRRALERIYQMLVPQGRLVIALPNVESIEARIFGSRWIEVDIPGHLFFFSARRLKALLEAAGFHQVRARPQVHPSTVSDSVGFLLDDLLGLQKSKNRPWLYQALFPITAFSYAVGNWGCVEVTAQKP